MTYAIIHDNQIIGITDDIRLCLLMTEKGMTYQEMEPCQLCKGLGLTLKEKEN